MWKDWRLNERSYGALTGQSIEDMVGLYGAETVASWRRSFDARPPPHEPYQPHNPIADAKYLRWEDRDGRTSRVLPPDSESLGDVARRVRPLWKQCIMRDVLDGKTVLVVAHGNTIRTLMQAIDNVPDAAASLLEVPQCIPLVYRFVLAHGKLIPEPCEGRKSAVDCAAIAEGGGVFDKADADAMISAEFLADEAELAQAQLRVRDASLARYGLAGGDESQLLEAVLCAGAALPGLECNVGADVADLEGAVRALRMAALEEEAGACWAAGADLYFNSISWGWDEPGDAAPAEAAPGEPAAEGSAAEAEAATAEAEAGPNASAGQSASAAPRDEPRRSYAVAAAAAAARAAYRQRRQRVIIIRHGKTHHNKLGLFTGWEDAKLAPEGRAEAIAAGRMLARHGVAVDVVYTSWLSRAIETAWLVLAQLDAISVPIHKSWRLNERMCVQHRTLPHPQTTSPASTPSPSPPPLVLKHIRKPQAPPQPQSLSFSFVLKQVRRAHRSVQEEDQSAVRREAVQALAARLRHAAAARRLLLALLPGQRRPLRAARA